jgi:hypothetical protein
MRWSQECSGTWPSKAAGCLQDNVVVPQCDEGGCWLCCTMRDSTTVLQDMGVDRAAACGLCLCSSALQTVVFNSYK